MKRSLQSGFTLLEAMVTTALVVPLLIAVVSTGDLVSKTLGANTAAADVVASIHDSTRRALVPLRAASKGTFEGGTVTAQTTTKLGLLGKLLVFTRTLVGWTTTVDNTDYSCVRFASRHAASVSDGPSAPTSLQLEFAYDSTEIKNGIDDDGDGLVDEGRLFLTRPGGGRTVLLEGVESCTFKLDGRLLRAKMQVARKAPDGRLRRGVAEHVVFLRN
jgi:hypothetical protein